jgi:PIN domain nuclease of toxin-antitoxin system
VNDANIVADASAVIALLVGEPFTRFDPLRLPNASISTVNLSEVLARLEEIGMPENEIALAVATLSLRAIAFDEPQARAAA